MRITRSSLDSRLLTLNMALKRPTNQFASQPGESTKFSVGHICLERSASGYTLEEQVSENGAVTSFASGMTPIEADRLIQGMLHGVTLKNAQLLHEAA
jgi:hypothetical protein